MLSNQKMSFFSNSRLLLLEFSLKLPSFNLNKVTRQQFSLITKLFNCLTIVIIVLNCLTNCNDVLAAKAVYQPQSVADTEAPNVVITSPTTNQSFGAGAMITILFRSTDNVAVISQNILISIDGTNFISLSKGLEGSITSLDTMFPRVATAKGVLRVEAFDAAGNVGFTLVNFSLLPDTQSPVVAVIAPQAGVKLKGNTMFTVIFSSLDNVGTISHEIRIALDGKNFTPFVNGIEGEERSAIIHVPNVKAKRVLIRIISTDFAGNIGMADSEAFSIKRSK